MTPTGRMAAVQSAAVARSPGEQQQAEQPLTGLAPLASDLAGGELLLQQILDTSSVAIFLVNLRGRIIHANRRMAEMFGWSQAELVDMEYVALVDPIERDI